MSDKDFLSKTLNETILTRRDFLKWSVALGGTVTLAGGVSFGLKQIDSAAGKASVEGKWIPAACWGDCGTKGFNRAFVSNGSVIRMGTDNTHEDSPDYPLIKSCSKGRSMRFNVFSTDRLKYPMKRKNWEPGGGKKELRGRDEWVRISWDEALDLVAGEIKRIKEKYGNEAILYHYAPPFGLYAAARLLNLYGGHVASWGAESSGTWTESWRFGFTGDTDDRITRRKAQLIVLWGYNPAWSRAGLPVYAFLQCKKAGAKFISVDPFYNPTAKVMADEWIPVRPCTDHAFMLGMVHTLLSEDDPANNPLIDWDFLNRCTVGFDAEHMPEGTDPKLNFKDYVLGGLDGVPKTPEWASEICGVPPERIRTLAREIATTNNVVIYMAPASARVTKADSWPQLVMTFGAMTGHIGKDGSMVGQDDGHAWLKEGDRLVDGGGFMGEVYPWTLGNYPPVDNPIEQISGTDVTGLEKMGGLHTAALNHAESWDAILTGKYTAGYNDVRDINIQMIWNEKFNHLNQCVGTVKGIQAFRKVEFVLSQNITFCPSVQYADIVLPVSTPWERSGLLTQGFREQMEWTSQITEPLFEAQSDLWIAKEIGKRLGIDPNEVEPVPEKQNLFNQVAAAVVIKDDGSGYEPLVTITEADIEEFGVDLKPQQGRIPLKQFKEQGIYQYPRHEGDGFEYIPLKEFREDPAANPLETASGKLEIFCQDLADHVKACGYTEISPIPEYQQPIEGYEDTFADWDNKVKGDYPLQFLSLHIPTHTHSQFANVPQLREAFPHVVFINPIDAKERGINTGDEVLVSSRHGKVVRPAAILEDIMPGVVFMGQGAWLDWDDDLGIDFGGCANVLCGAIPSGQGHQGWNSTNVQVEKWHEKPLGSDLARMVKLPVFAKS